ncbi:hypothetical protein KCP77_16295 [Salmonella enterica subsp. enterica]|nr:hypothetical protein KCP77_16295 [Salmonella enterica subsp. enterica]
MPLKILARTMPLYWRSGYESCDCRAAARPVVCPGTTVSNVLPAPSKTVLTIDGGHIARVTSHSARGASFRQ